MQESIFFTVAGGCPPKPASRIVVIGKDCACKSHHSSIFSFYFF